LQNSYATEQGIFRRPVHTAAAGIDEGAVLAPVVAAARRQLQLAGKVDPTLDHDVVEGAERLAARSEVLVLWI
jgi:hypothetical protein